MPANSWILEGVRRAEPADRPGLLALVEASNNFSGVEKACAVELIDLALRAVGSAAPDYRLLIAPGPQGAPVGYICFGEANFARGTFDLYWIAVHPEARRRGLGRRLLSAFEAEARSLGARLLLITTTAREDYLAAHATYRAADFTVAARIPNYYAPGEDQLIFGKQLTPPSASPPPRG